MKHRWGDTDGTRPQHCDSQLTHCQFVHRNVTWSASRSIPGAKHTQWWLQNNSGRSVQTSNRCLLRHTASQLQLRYERSNKHLFQLRHSLGHDVTPAPTLTLLFSVAHFSLHGTTNGLTADQFVLHSSVPIPRASRRTCAATSSAPLCGGSVQADCGRR